LGRKPRVGDPKEEAGLINIDQSASTRRRDPVMTSALQSMICTRGLRDFGDGFVVVLLPVYLTALGSGLID
jgi:hypothetical protein